MTCAFHLADDVRNARSELLTACQDVSDADLHRPPDILADLSRRSGERHPPPAELDYIDRLLRRF